MLVAFAAKYKRSMMYVISVDFRCIKLYFYFDISAVYFVRP